MLLVVAGVIPLFTFILGYQFLEYLKDVDATGLQTLALARSMSLLVDEEIQSRIAALRTLALSRSLADGDLLAFRAKAEAVALQQFPGANILLVRRDGQQIINTLLPLAAPLPVRPNMESTSEVFATGRPAVSNMFQGAVGSRWVVAIDVPVEDRDGEVVYVLSLNPRLDDFAEVIRRQQLPSDWISTVIDRNGVIVARIPNTFQYVGQEVTPATVARLRIKREGIDENISKEGIRILAVFSRAERFGWTVSIGVPSADLTGPALWAATRTLALGGLLLGLSLVLALYAARRIAGPIESLRRLAAMTDFSNSLDLMPSGLPEVDEVAQALRAAEDARRKSRNAEAVLRDGIETIPEGFVIYDDNDRLAMCNDSYRRLFAGFSDHVVTGVQFADIWRAGVARGSFPAAKGHEEEWIEDRVRELHDFGGEVEQLLEDGQWIMAKNRRLSNGWIAGLRINITARKATEQALIKGEARFRLVVEAVPNAIVVFAADGTIELVNVQTECMFGYSRDELLGRPVEMLLAEQLRPDHAITRNAFFAAMQIRPMGSGRLLRGCRRDGKEFPIEIGMNPMETADGTKALVSIVDTTARRQADRINAYYVAIVESSADAIIAEDLDMFVTSWNKSAELMFGWSAREMIGEPISRLIPADRLEEEAAILAQIYQGRRIDHYETVRRRKNGDQFPVSLTISPIRGPAGDVIGASKIVRDITEQTQLEKTLQASEDRFRSIFSAVGEGIFIISAQDGTFTEINGAGCLMFGYDSEALIGSDLEALSSGVAPYTGRQAAERIERAATSGQPQRFGWHCKARDGRLFWADISIRSAVISGQHAVLAIVRDVTEWRTVEAQLRQARKMEAIGNLSGGMAHDFNNMLGVIIGSLDLAAPLVKNNPDAAELVEEAIAAALSSAELTRRLLAFARKQPLRAEHIRPNDLISSIVRLLRRTLGENIEIALDLADELWPVIADPAQLEACLTNLATNARDAMPNGGRLAIATLNQCLDADYAAANVDAAAGDYVALIVSDTGTGMDPDVAQQIFEPFYTTKELGKGTGLGLSMVFGFIKQSGGHISVYSERGVGTTFRLYLPRAADGTAPAPTVRTALPNDGAGKTVLAVEDNQRLRQVVMRQLNELGYRPIEADGPSAALAILERENIDLLFSDVIMPGEIDGVALARQVNARWPSVKVLLTSGFAGSKLDDRLDARDKAFPLISKPYRVEDLAESLHEVFKN